MILGQHYLNNRFFLDFSNTIELHVITTIKIYKQFDITHIILSMFQNSYQNGTYFDLFDPKSSQQKLKLLYRTVNVQGNNKVFDKDLKTFVLEFVSPTAKMCLPKEQKKDLYLIQQYLVFQIFFFPGQTWNIELVISDLNKTKRRVILSPTTHKTEIKPFFVKTPCHGFKEGIWNNFTVDLYSFMEAFKGQTYRSLDAIYLTGHFKLRRIYSTTSEPFESEGENQSQQIKQINFLPKNFYYSVGVPYVTRINKFQYDNISQITYEPTEPSTKNSSFLKGSKPKQPNNAAKIETIKTEKHIEKTKIKDFLSNTNGQLIARTNKDEAEKSQSQSSQVNILIGQPKTVKSTEKYAKNKKNLIKTQQMPPKARSSLDKGHIKIKIEDKSKTKAKLNPWRPNEKQTGFTDASQLEISKHQEHRNIDSAQTVSMFKTKNNLMTKFSDSRNRQKKSEHYSDSEYVELSQKFSTLTDGKFFKNEIIQNQNEEIKNDQDQIQQNIEMQTNSMYSNSNKKEEKEQEKHENIVQSICDSLDKQDYHKKEQMGRSSLYGFGQKLMKKFMGEIERPYSPPLGERQITQQDLDRNYQQQKQQVELIYDPVLNCYYDHKTHTYYQLKN